MEVSEGNTIVEDDENATPLQPTKDLKVIYFKRKLVTAHPARHSEIKQRGLQRKFNATRS